MRDVEMGEDSPTSNKKPLGFSSERRFPLTRLELTVVFAVFCVFLIGLFFIYHTMPSAKFGQLKFPRSISDLRILKDQLGIYASIHPRKFILGYCCTYIFMQTFMMPGTIFMSLLAGALFGVIKGDANLKTTIVSKIFYWNNVFVLVVLARIWMVAWFRTILRVGVGF